MRRCGTGTRSCRPQIGLKTAVAAAEEVGVEGLVEQAQWRLRSRWAPPSSIVLFVTRHFMVEPTSMCALLLTLS